MVSVLSRCKGIGEPTVSHVPLHFRSSFGRRTPRSMRRALDGMTDPQVANWQYLGATFKSENNPDSREAQGMTTDGSRWYLCSNGSKRIIVFDDDWNRVVTISPTSTIWDAWWNDPNRSTPADEWGPGQENPHLGAPCIHENILYIPIQGPRGVWRLNLTSAEQSWLHPSKLPDGDLFPWVSIHPVTGLLYTSNYHTPDVLHAYDRSGQNTLQYVKEHNIPLAKTDIYLDYVQGGAFTDCGRIILVRHDYNAIFCFSSLNGHFFGSRKIGTDDWDEAESVTVRPWQFQGNLASVHVFELDNDATDLDDCYLRCFAIPDPSKL